MQKELEELRKIFKEKNHQLYLVGGAVRDKLLGRGSKDIDLATDTKPEKMLSLLEGKFRHQHIGFGTVAIFADSGTIEISTFRKIEKYSGIDRIPEVIYGENIEEDLERRDFTINAMAMNLETEKLIDPYFGQSDLARKQLRVPRNSKLPLREDPLRMLRAARFISEFGFEACYNLVVDSMDLASHILFISRERWLMEMNRILLGDNVKNGLNFLRQTGLINFILPGSHQHPRRIV
ncbi:CC-adding tRNA nucleotidyltransferase [subsurface metagenome]